MAKDKRLKNKGKYGMDSRTVWFVAESKEDQDRLQVEYPGKILLCDRTFVLDTQGKKAIANTTQLHEVRSVAEEVPPDHPRKWPVHTARLPCKCIHCHGNPLNTECIYTPWRDPKRLSVGIHCLYPEEAKEWIGVGIIHEKKVSGVKQVREGTVENFLPSEGKWEALMQDGSTEVLTYQQLCRAKANFDKKNKNN